MAQVAAAVWRTALLLRIVLAIIYGCEGTTYVTGPRVGNDVFGGFCSSWHGNRAEAEQRCNADALCSVMHDYDCLGFAWSFCTATIEELMKHSTGTDSCSAVAEEVMALVTSTGTTVSTDTATSASRTTPTRTTMTESSTTTFATATTTETTTKSSVTTFTLTSTFTTTTEFYVDGPRLSNAAFHTHCVSYIQGGSRMEAQRQCNADPDCRFLHDYDCVGWIWHYCTSTVEAAQAAGTGTEACTVLRAKYLEPTTTTTSTTERYVDGPRVGNEIYHSHCVADWWSASEAEAAERCDADTSCSVLHNYDCRGIIWHYCNTPIESIRTAGGGTAACTRVERKVWELVTDTSTNTDTGTSRTTSTAVTLTTTATPTTISRTSVTSVTSQTSATSTTTRLTLFTSRTITATTTTIRYVEGPRVSNAVQALHCSAQHVATRTQAEDQCNADETCTVLLDFDCVGLIWYYCTSPLETIMASSGTATDACSLVTSAALKAMTSTVTSTWSFTSTVSATTTETSTTTVTHSHTTISTATTSTTTSSTKTTSTTTISLTSSSTQTTTSTTGTSSTTSTTDTLQFLPFNCYEGLPNWQIGWSSPKKLYCCEHFGVCTSTTTTTSTLTSSTSTSTTATSSTSTTSTFTKTSTTLTLTSTSTSTRTTRTSSTSTRTTLTTTTSTKTVTTSTTSSATSTTSSSITSSTSTTSLTTSTATTTTTSTTTTSSTTSTSITTTTTRLTVIGGWMDLNVSNAAIFVSDNSAKNVLEEALATEAQVSKYNVTVALSLRQRRRLQSSAVSMQVVRAEYTIIVYAVHGEGVRQRMTSLVATDESSRAPAFVRFGMDLRRRFEALDRDGGYALEILEFQVEIPAVEASAGGDDEGPSWLPPTLVAGAAVFFLLLLAIAMQASHLRRRLWPTADSSKRAPEASEDDKANNNQPVDRIDHASSKASTPRRGRRGGVPPRTVEQQKFMEALSLESSPSITAEPTAESTVRLDLETTNKSCVLPEETTNKSDTWSRMVPDESGADMTTGNTGEVHVPIANQPITSVVGPLGAGRMEVVHPNFKDVRVSQVFEFSSANWVGNGRSSPGLAPLGGNRRMDRDSSPCVTPARAQAHAGARTPVLQRPASLMDSDREQESLQPPVRTPRSEGDEEDEAPSPASSGSATWDRPMSDSLDEPEFDNGRPVLMSRPNKGNKIARRAKKSKMDRGAGW